MYKVDNKIRLQDSRVTPIDVLKVGIYSLLRDELGFYLSETNGFEYPSKVYGDEEVFSQKCVDAFLCQDRNSNVLLTGKKGTGKSLQVKLISRLAQVPTILVAENYEGQQYCDAIAKIGKSVVVLEEFDKYYPEQEQQEKLLVLLDGTYGTNSLFVLTSNSKNLSQYFYNRPSRIKYHRDYDNLRDSVIEEVISDTLVNKEHTAELQEVVDILADVSMDVLQEVIKETNRTKKSPKEAIRDMNVRVEHGEFDVVATLDGKRVESHVYYNPLLRDVIYFWYEKRDHISESKESGFYEERKENLALTIEKEKYTFRGRDVTISFYKKTKNNLSELF